MTRRDVTVHLGYEVGTGEAVSIPIRHMAVTGQTQESGKTTTLEALIARSGLRAIAFTTKRAELGFYGATPILPFFQERSDWEFVSSIMETLLKEKKKFERPWIVKACQGTKTLAQIQSRLPLLEAKTKNALSKDMYMMLGVYLDKVVPLLRQLPQSPRLELARDGLTVMHLESYPEELQMLVIASTLEWIHKHEENVINIIPEAWKFAPRSRNTPVKLVAEKLAREGAAIKNYVWVDSQDIVGVSYEILRACAVWLFGVQRQVNEVKRVIANIPAGIKAPKPADVSTLDLGQFYAAHGKELRKVYVQPAWMPEGMAVSIAQGLTTVGMAETLKKGIGVQHETLGSSDPHSVPEHLRSASGKMDGALGVQASQARHDATARVGVHSQQGGGVHGVQNGSVPAHELTRLGEGAGSAGKSQTLPVICPDCDSTDVTQLGLDKKPDSWDYQCLKCGTIFSSSVKQTDDPFGDAEINELANYGYLKDEICPKCEDEASEHVVVEFSGMEDEGTIVCLHGKCRCTFSAESYPDFTRRVLASHGQSPTKEEEVRKVWTEDELVERLQNVGIHVEQSGGFAEKVIRALLPIINGVSPAAAGGKDGAESQSGLSKQTSAPSDDLEETLQASHNAARIGRHALIAEIIAQIRKDPVLIKLSQIKPAIEVKIERKVVNMNMNSVQGKIAALISEHFFNGEGKDFKAIRQELIRRGVSASTGNAPISKALKELTDMGFFYRGENKTFIAVPDAEVRIVA